MKIITSGYFEDDGNGEVEILSEAETAQFSSLIVSLLAGDQEAKEQKRMETLEANYNFNPQKPRTKKSLYDDPEWQKITSYFHHEDEEEEEEEDENLPNFYI